MYPIFLVLYAIEREKLCNLFPNCLHCLRLSYRLCLLHFAVKLAHVIFIPYGEKSLMPTLIYVPWIF